MRDTHLIYLTDSKRFNTKKEVIPCPKKIKIREVQYPMIFYHIMNTSILKDGDVIYVYSAKYPDRIYINGNLYSLQVERLYEGVEK